MEDPKAVWLSPPGQYPLYLSYEGPHESNPVKYIRSDLVDKLIERTKHRGDCLTVVAKIHGWPKDCPCTCGLYDLINEIRG